MRRLARVGLGEHHLAGREGCQHVVGGGAARAGHRAAGGEVGDGAEERAQEAARAAGAATGRALAEDADLSLLGEIADRVRLHAGEHRLEHVAQALAADDGLGQSVVELVEPLGGGTL